MPQSRVPFTAVLALLALAGPAVAQDGPPSGSTFVYLNSAEIIQSTPGAAEAQRTFDQEISDRRGELEEEAAVVDSLVRDYQQQEELLSPQAKEQKQQEIRSRQQALQTRRTEM
ncbi:MAG: OmpH family outer membrane protein, partial [Gemmatimonadota bacterium]